MNKYEEQFKMFGLTSSDLPEYKNPEQYARNFKKCSVLEEKRVSYSSDSLTNYKPVLTSSTHNK